ncbi:unnamed protein product [Caenorhabditis bovis]|uniref:RNA-binding protein 42 n=1 Tax=Caenorhabditis bovis TaxID=2654633 RepID=A0A8S1EM39_9PELO|nr:unnamed protein product [Caenorhabditis bovis]
MACLEDELALFESEIAQIEKSNPQVEPKGGYENATISAAPEPAESSSSKSAASHSAPQSYLSSSPFIANSLGKPPMPPANLLSRQSSSQLQPPAPPPTINRNMASATIEGAPTLYETPAINSIPVEMLRTQALQSDIDKMHFKRQTDPLKKRIKEQQTKKKFVRSGGGQVWEDSSLAEWDENDFRIFCGDLGNEVSDELLAKAFRKYPSFQKAKVIRESRSNKSKGYGFVSFRESDDYVRAMREMDGKYVGNRPIKLRKSTWKERNIDVIKKKNQKKKELGIII